MHRGRFTRRRPATSPLCLLHICNLLNGVAGANWRLKQHTHKQRRGHGQLCLPHRGSRKHNLHRRREHHHRSHLHGSAMQVAKQSTPLQQWVHHALCAEGHTTPFSANATKLALPLRTSLLLKHSFTLHICLERMCRGMPCSTPAAIACTRSKKCTEDASLAGAWLLHLSAYFTSATY